MRFVLAQVGEPVPGEHALAADDESSRKGLMASRKASGSAGRSRSKTVLPLAVEDVDEHASGVQIDAAVELVLVGCSSAWLCSS